jgi:phosphatidylserine decarboxylase
VRNESRPTIIYPTPRFVVVSVLSHREQTPVSKKTINPVYSPKDSTFDFPIHLSLADKLGVVELILWDKDMLMKKEYLGEAALPLENWFKDGESGRQFAWEDATVRLTLLTT